MNNMNIVYNSIIIQNSFILKYKKLKVTNSMGKGKAIYKTVWSKYKEQFKCNTINRNLRKELCYKLKKINIKICNKFILKIIQ